MNARKRTHSVLALGLVLGVVAAFNGSLQAELIVYEPFHYRADYGSFGDTNGGYGFGGDWTRARSAAPHWEFRQGGLSFPGCVVTGNSLYRPAATARARANRVLFNATRTALLGDNTTMWFSILTSSTAASNGSFAITTANFGTGTAPALGSIGYGFGFTKRNAAGTATTFINALAFTSSTAATISNGTFDAGTGAVRMIVGKINWKPFGTNDQLFLFNVTNASNPEPAEGSAIATITANLNQSLLYIVGVYDDGAMTVDEIRLGTTYLDVTGRDTDGDGMTDSFELAHTSPPSATALNPGDDLEPDGLTNLEEYQNMSDPTKPDAQFVYYDFSNSTNRWVSNTAGGGKNLTMTFAGNYNTGVSFSTMNINGVNKDVMFVPNSFGTSNYSRYFHYFPPNAGLGLVNQYTFITDMRWPPSENGTWRSILAVYWEMAYVNTSNQLTIYPATPASQAAWWAPDPVPGQDHPGGSIQPDTWYRIVYAVDLSKNVDSFVTYLNGVRVASTDLTDMLDHYYFASFCDNVYHYGNANEVGDSYIAGAQVRNYTVTADEAAAMGVATGAGIPTPTTSSAPLKLTATTYSLTGVLLQWADTSNNELGFQIERKEGATGTYARIGLTGPNSTDYIDTGLTIGTKYFYRVCAYNSLGASGYSNEVAFTALPSLGARRWSVYK